MNRINQKFNLSLVSGGKPVVPQAHNGSCSKKSVACLTADKLNYIVPFNNQIKVYSVETKQCFKTLKFSNNEVLTQIFQDEDNLVADILLGDITKEEDNKKQDKLITVFTTKGDFIILNYKSKLADDLIPHKLDLEDSNETVLKVFEDSKSEKLRILTTLPSEVKGSYFVYKLYEFFPSEKDNKFVKLVKTFENVILSSWSTDSSKMVLLYDNDKKKHILVESLFDDSTKVDFNFSEIMPETNTSTKFSNSSSNSRYISTMAVDNQGNQLALGFASGVIHLVTLADLQSRILKWHIDTILSLSFNKDGTYLLSGGWEKVLSFWQLSTHMQQFLPRLNGIIIDSNIINDDKLYSLTLQMTENTSNSDYQLLLLNATDLTSKLSINGPLPVFNSTIKGVLPPLSAVASKSSTTSTKMNSLKKKHKKKIMKSIRQDYTTCADINPISKHIFFPHVSAIQSFDFYKSEQMLYQYLTSSVNNSMGKVRSELNIKEPVIMNVKFTKNGKWMITYEIEYPPDNLLSSRNLTYILKFWYKQDNESEWTLKTKVMNPHGENVPITNILAAPFSVNESNGCLTADNNGGLKFWTFEEYEKNWCLTKILLGNFNHFSNSVSLAWSNDGSLIFHSFDDKLIILDFETFKKIETTPDNDFVNEMTFDSEIQTIRTSKETNLVVVTRTTINLIDLLTFEIKNSFDLYPYVQGTYKNGNFDRLLSCNENTGEIAIIINERLTEQTNEADSCNYKSYVIIFDSTLSEKLNTFVHDQYISWISWNHDTDFFFIDIGSKLGVVTTTVNTEMLDEVNREGIFDKLGNEEDKFLIELKKLSKSSETKKSKSSNDESDQEDGVEMEFDIINGEKTNKIINMNSFTSMFDNLETIQMDTFFDRVMRAIT